MSLLLDLLKETYTVYNNMERGRLGYYLRYKKAHIFKNLFDAHLTLLDAKSASPAAEKLLAEAILTIRCPDTTATTSQNSAKATENSNASAAASENATKSSAKDVKDEMPNKTKFEIMTAILTICANLQLGNLTLATCEEQINTLQPLFEKEFVGVEGANYLIPKVKAFLPAIAELSAAPAYKRRLIDLELENNQKTRLLADLEARLKTNHEAIAEHEKKILALQAKFYPLAENSAASAEAELRETFERERQTYQLASDTQKSTIKKLKQQIANLQACLEERDKKIALINLQKVTQSSSSASSSAFSPPAAPFRISNTHSIFNNNNKSTTIRPASNTGANPSALPTLLSSFMRLTRSDQDVK